MLTLSQELHGIPEETLRDYLIRLGGVSQTSGIISGQDWQARMNPLPDYRLGRAAFCSFLVEIEGKQEVVESIMRQFKLRIMRPGG